MKATCDTLYSMRTVVFAGRGSEEDVRKILSPYDIFDVVSDEPDIVIAYGGDGALLKAEFEYPGIPKLFLKNSEHAHKAHRRSNEEVLRIVSKGNYDVFDYMKLEALFRGTSISALNDIVIHNADPRHALRYVVQIDGLPFGEEIIGDGVIVSTPVFGATGYYRSVTDSTFETGIGLAFNNSHEQRDHIVLKESREISVEITRGPALCYADNQTDFFTLSEGDTALIKKSQRVARIISAHRN